MKYCWTDIFFVSKNVYCIRIGTEKKRVRFEDEVEELADRRRSSRIIALEEKKRQEKERKRQEKERKRREKERKLALALEKKKNSTNHNDNKDKEKGKAILIEDEDHLNDFDEDEKHASTKKRFTKRAFYQFISSFKVLCFHIFFLSIVFLFFDV